MRMQQKVVQSVSFWSGNPMSDVTRLDEYMDCKQARLTNMEMRDAKVHFVGIGGATLSCF